MLFIHLSVSNSQDSQRGEKVFLTIIFPQGERAKEEGREPLLLNPLTHWFTPIHLKCSVTGLLIESGREGGLPVPPLLGSHNSVINIQVIVPHSAETIYP